MLPSVSRPKIMVILGLTSSFATELVVPGFYHFMRLKSVMPSQVSSTFRKTFFLRAQFKNSRAQRCLITRFFSELECRETVLILRKCMPRSSFITYQTALAVTWSPLEVLISSATAYAESIMQLKSFLTSTAFLMSYLWSSLKAIFAMISPMNEGFFLALCIKAATTCGDTLWSLATSAYFSRSKRT